MAIAVVLIFSRFADGPRGLVTRFTLPAQLALRSVGNSVREATGSVGDLATLRERNLELEQLVAQLTVDNLRLIPSPADPDCDCLAFIYAPYGIVILKK